MPRQKTFKSDSIDFHRLLYDGIVTCVQARGGGVTKGRIEEEIAAEIGISDSLLRGWQRDVRPTNYGIVRKLAAVCVEKSSGKLGEKWVKQLLSQYLVLLDYDEKAKEEIPEKVRPSSTDSTSIKTQEVMNSDFGESEKLLSEFNTAVMNWAQKIYLSGGKSGFIDQAYVHSLLERFSLIGFEDDRGGEIKIGEDWFSYAEGLIYAEDLLYSEKIHAFIIAPTGSGKSTLLQNLSRLLAQGAAGDLLPIPLNWRDEESLSSRDLLLNTVNLLLPDLSESKKKELITLLEQRLVQGTAIALTDNYYRSKISDPRYDRIPERMFLNWKRVIIFARYSPKPEYTQEFILFKLSPLNPQALRYFVQSWSRVTGHQLDSEKIISTVTVSSWLDSLATIPLFLDIFCYGVFSGRIKHQDHLWSLLDLAIEKITEVETGNPIPGGSLRKILAEIAWYQYKNKYSLKPTDLWREKRDLLNHELFSLAYHKGLIRDIADSKELEFVHPVVWIALAAEGWLLEIQADRLDWLTVAEQVKSNPYLAYIIRFVAAQLGKQAYSLENLEQLLTHLCSQSQADLFGLNWLWAGQCLSELDHATQKKFDRNTEIVKEICHRLIDWAEHSQCSKLADEANRLLEEIQTPSLLKQLAECAPDKQRSFSFRCRAIEVLGKSGWKDGLKTLKGIALDTKDISDIRYQAVHAIGRTKLPEVIPFLVQLLDDYILQLDALMALAAHNTPTAVHIMMQTGRPVDLEAFDWINSPAVLPELEQALFQYDGYMKQQILRVIARVGGEKTIELLAKILDSEDDLFFNNVADLLKEMRHPRACQALIAFAQNEKFPIIQRLQALAALPRDQGLWDVEQVTELLFQIDIPTTQEAITALSAATNAVTDSLDTNLITQLERICEKAQGEKQLFLIDIIALKRHPKFVPLLRSLTKNPDYEVRHLAILGLVRLGIREVIDQAKNEVQQALENGWKLAMLIDTFKIIKDAQVLSLLVKANHAEIVEHQLAIEALGDIGGESVTQFLIELWHQWRPDETKIFERGFLLDALSGSGELAGVEILLEVAADLEAQPLETYVSLHALADVDNSAAVGVLTEALVHPDREIMYKASAALTKMAASGKIPESAIFRVMEIIDEENYWWILESAKCVLKEVVSHTEVVENPEFIKFFMEGLTENTFDDPLWVISLIGLRKIPGDLITNAMLDILQHVLLTSTSEEVLKEAVQTWLVFKGAAGIEFLYYAIREKPGFLSDDPYFLGEKLAQPEYLCALLKQRPLADPILCYLSLLYVFLIMPDDTIILVDGTRLPCEKAIRWIDTDK